MASGITVIVCFSVFALTLSSLTIMLHMDGIDTPPSDAFAQNTLDEGDFLPSPASSTNPSLQTFSDSTTPVISRLSHEGIYEVQLLWSVPQSVQSPNILPKKGFDMHIEFLDASAPDQTDRTIGQDLLSDELHPVPIVKPLLPVESYDIAIYSELGDILWNQNDNRPASGRGFERVILDETYEGNITVSVTDIRSPFTTVADSVQLPAVLG
jgi:hypothetical protein